MSPWQRRIARFEYFASEVFGSAQQAIRVLHVVKKDSQSQVSFAKLQMLITLHESVAA